MYKIHRCQRLIRKVRHVFSLYMLKTKLLTLREKYYIINVYDFAWSPILAHDFGSYRKNLLKKDDIGYKSNQKEVYFAD